MCPTHPLLHPHMGEEEGQGEAELVGGHHSSKVVGRTLSSCLNDCCLSCDFSPHDCFPFVHIAPGDQRDSLEGENDEDAACANWKAKMFPSTCD